SVGLGRGLRRGGSRKGGEALERRGRLGAASLHDHRCGMPFSPRAWRIWSTWSRRMGERVAARSLAAAQTVPKRGDVEANVEGHIRLIHVAAEAHARVLVFPELSLTGYELDLADELAFSEDDARLNPLLDSASSFGMTLVVGAPVRIGSLLHIGAFILSP